jgi:SAM-dependent methyltransferase
VKRKIEIALAGILILASIGFMVFSRSAQTAGSSAIVPSAAESARVKETTLRNVTDKIVTYKIYPAQKPERIQTKEIAPGAIDRYRTADILAIEFSTGGKDVIYSLDPGKPYSFRYDEGSNIDLFLGSHGRADAVDLAPYVPSPDAVVDKMLELAKITANDMIYDIGCGDGRIVIAAARKYGASGVGIDIDAKMVAESRRNAGAAGVEKRVKFIAMDATRADVSPASVVTLYLLPESNALLRPLLERQLRPGTRVVCHNYTIPGWEARRTQVVTLKDESGTDHTIYVYVR